MRCLSRIEFAPVTELRVIPQCSETSRSQHRFNPVAMNTSSVQQLLTAIEQPLTALDHLDWLVCIRECSALIHADLVAGRTATLRLFGGLGSLNDVVVYRKGVVLVEQNDNYAPFVKSFTRTSSSTCRGQPLGASAPNDGGGLQCPTRGARKTQWVRNF